MKFFKGERGIRRWMREPQSIYGEWVIEAMRALEEHPMPLTRYQKWEHGADIVWRVASVLYHDRSGIFDTVFIGLLHLGPIPYHVGIKVMAWVLMNNIAPISTQTLPNRADYPPHTALSVGGLESTEKWESRRFVYTISAYNDSEPTNLFWDEAEKYDAELAKAIRASGVFDARVVREALESGVDVELLKAVIT